MLHKVMLAGEGLLCNTLNIDVVYRSKLGQSITGLSLPLAEAYGTMEQPEAGLTVLAEALTLVDTRENAGTNQSCIGSKANSFCNGL